jgi:hypothetical protein
VYIAIDIHDTIIAGNRTVNNDGKQFYPHAKEVLQNLSKNPVVKLILYSCSHQKPAYDFINWLKENGINIYSYNCNPDFPSTELCDFSQKFFFDIIIDDKGGAEMDKGDWLLIKNELIEINQWISN